MPRQAAAALTRASTGPFVNVIGLSEGWVFEREREGVRDREGTGKRGRMYARLLYASACQGWYSSACILFSWVPKGGQRRRIDLVHSWDCYAALGQLFAVGNGKVAIYISHQLSWCCRSVSWCWWRGERATAFHMHTFSKLFLTSSWMSPNLYFVVMKNLECVRPDSHRVWNWVVVQDFLMKAWAWDSGREYSRYAWESSWHGSKRWYCV